MNAAAAGRIALFLPSLAGGGAERVMVVLANAFAGRGLAVDLILAAAKGPYLADVQPGVGVVDLRARRVAHSLIPLARYLRRVRPACLLSALSHANVLALLATRLSRVGMTVVVTEHVPLDPRDAGRSQAFAGVLKRLMRWSYPWADAIVAVSDGVAESVSRAVGLPRSCFQRIYNPGPTPEWLERANEPIDHPWFASGAPPVILAMGRLAPEKDFATLIGAFERLRSDRACRLMILGEGALRADLEARVRRAGLSNDIALPGFQRNPFPYLRRAALLALSSQWEGLPGALIEAMACGTPVVSTECGGGAGEILDHGKWGRLVPAGDVDALARAMRSTMDDPVKPDVRRRAADFSQMAAVERYLQVMKLG